MARRAALIVNPVATGVTPAGMAAVVDELAVAGPVEKLETRARGHAAELAAEACDRYDEIFVFGGDGVFNEAVNGMLPTVPIGFIPGGATSVLPRALGLPRNPIACAKRLAGHGQRAGSPSAASTGAASRSVPASGSTPSSSGASTSVGGRTASVPAISPTSPISRESCGARKGRISSDHDRRRAWPVRAARGGELRSRTPSPVRSRCTRPRWHGSSSASTSSAHGSSPARGFAHLVWSLVRATRAADVPRRYLYAHDIDAARVDLRRARPRSRSTARISAT